MGPVKCTSDFLEFEYKLQFGIKYRKRTILIGRQFGFQISMNICSKLSRDG